VGFGVEFIAGALREQECLETKPEIRRYAYSGIRAYSKGLPFARLGTVTAPVSLAARMSSGSAMAASCQ
jgi:hypothetical protein